MNFKYKFLYILLFNNYKALDLSGIITGGILAGSSILIYNNYKSQIKDFFTKNPSDLSIEIQTINDQSIESIKKPVNNNPNEDTLINNKVTNINKETDINKENPLINNNNSEINLNINNNPINIDEKKFKEYKKVLYNLFENILKTKENLGTILKKEKKKINEEIYNNLMDFLMYFFKVNFQNEVKNSKTIDDLNKYFNSNIIYEPTGEFKTRKYIYECFLKNYNESLKTNINLINNFSEFNRLEEVKSLIVYINEYNKTLGLLLNSNFQEVIFNEK